jgi:hypothetical protein
MSFRNLAPTKDKGQRCFISLGSHESEEENYKRIKVNKQLNKTKKIEVKEHLCREENEGSEEALSFREDR